MRDAYDYDAHRIKGNDKDAIEWIKASRLGDEDKKNLQKFVKKFPSQKFYKEDKELLDHVEQRDGVKLPSWLRQIRQTLAFVLPDMRIKFDEFEWATPRDESIGEVFFAFDLLGYTDWEQRKLYHDQAGVYPLCNWIETQRSVLGFKILRPDERTIFEWGRIDLLDTILDGHPPDRSLFRAFDSYTGMLTHVVAGKLDDGRVVKAKR